LESVIFIVIIVIVIVLIVLPLLLLLSILLSLTFDPIVVIVDVPPHAMADNDGNHGDICPAGGLVSVGDTKELVDVDDGGWLNVV
jgi:hypothetical protein